MRIKYKDPFSLWVTGDGHLAAAFLSNSADRIYFAIVYHNEKEIIVEHACPSRLKCWHVDRAVEVYRWWKGANNQIPKTVRVIRKQKITILDDWRKNDGLSIPSSSGYSERPWNENS
jgi:hypothetical protein